MWRRLTFLPKPRQIIFLSVLSILFVTMIVSIITTIIFFKDEGIVKIHTFLYNATTDTLNLDDTTDGSYVLNGLTVHSATFVNSNAASLAKSKIALDKFLIEVDFYSVDVMSSSIKGRVHVTVPPSYRMVSPTKNATGQPYVRVPSSSIPKIGITGIIGSKVLPFPPGKLIEDFDMLVSLTGDLSDYPFDEYKSTAYFTLYKSVDIVDNRTKLPLGIAITAAVQGFRIKADAGSTAFVEVDGSDEVGFMFSIRRSQITIGFSTFITTLMWLISLVMFTVAMDVVVGAAASKRATVPDWAFKRKGKIEVVNDKESTDDLEKKAIEEFRKKISIYRKARIVSAPLLAMPVALIFALPALRNVQPGVPQVGAYCDVVGFFWNVGLTAISAVAISSVWLVRKD